MGTSTTSMYAAFGNKEKLFRKALERYTEGPSAYLARAMEVSTALGVATAILAGTVRTTIRPAHPHGCLGVQSALTTSDSGQEVRDLLVAWRDNGYSCVRERFQRAVDDGDLPPRTDPGLLARYLTTFAYGIAVQAASGVDRDELQEWPTPPCATGHSPETRPACVLRPPLEGDRHSLPGPSHLSSDHRPAECEPHPGRRVRGRDLRRRDGVRHSRPPRRLRRQGGGPAICCPPVRGARRLSPMLSAVPPRASVRHGPRVLRRAEERTCADVRIRQRTRGEPTRWPGVA